MNVQERTPVWEGLHVRGARMAEVRSTVALTGSEWNLVSGAVTGALLSGQIDPYSSIALPITGKLILY